MAQDIYAEDTAFLEVLDSVNEKNRYLDAPNFNIYQYKYDFNQDKDFITPEDVKLIQAYDGNNPQIVKSMSRDDAKKEAAWLFRLLRSQYGLYTWFGGDEVFEKAEKKIYSELEKFTIISTEAYQEILLEHLQFIEDTHFMIGNTSFQPQVRLYSNEEKEFYKIGEEFFLDKEGTRMVTSVNGMDPDLFIKRAIDMNGELTWYLYSMGPYMANYPISILSGETEETILLKPANYLITEKKEGKSFSYRIKNGIPQIQLNFMMFGEGDLSGGRVLEEEKTKQTFLRSAAEIKNYPFAVIDLTNNPGGNGDLPAQWFEAFTGHTLQRNYCILRINPREAWMNYALGGEEYRKLWDKYMEENGMLKEENYYVSYPEKQFLQNENPVLFLLTSRITASAAEGFIDGAKNLENVVTIGSNSAGVLTNAANYSMAMPFSGLNLQFGECLYYWDKNYFREGVGIEPDIYLTGENTEERFQLFLERYCNGELN